MVQANELRIGNYISYKNERWIKVGYHEIRYAVLYPDTSYYPIPLTFEILEKAGLPDQEINEKGCGWFHRGNFLVGKTKYHYHFHKNSKRLTLAIVVTLEKGSDTTAFAWDIYYVHQLQNLYFALTGQELEVNLT